MPHTIYSATPFYFHFPNYSNHRIKHPDNHCEANLTGITIRMQMKPRAMTEIQLEHVKKEIIQIYFSLISKTENDTMVVEIMKLSALADVQRRYNSKEPWLAVD